MEDLIDGPVPRMVSVLVSRSDQVEGQWVAECLDIGLVTQGDSVKHAIEMTLEAVMLVIEEDLRAQRDTFSALWRLPSEDKRWRTYARVLSEGSPVSIEDTSRCQAVAAALLVHRKAVSPGLPARPLMATTAS